MSLYIANATKQNWRFWYRLPEAKDRQFIQIASGTQVMVGVQWTASETDYVVKELEKLGARPASDTNRKLDSGDGILYRLNKVISEDEIVEGHQAVVEHQQERAVNEAVKSAAAFDIASREGKSARGRRLAKVSEVSVKQDLPRGQRPTGNEVNFNLSVTPDGNETV
jgi:hypothetical protein